MLDLIICITSDDLSQQSIKAKFFVHLIYS